MDGPDQVVHRLVADQPLQVPVELIGADVDHPDSIVGVKHGHRVLGTHLNPMFQRGHVSCVKGMKEKRGQGEIVDPVNLGSDFNLFSVVGVNLNQGLQTTSGPLLLNPPDQLEGLGNHETAGARLFGSVAHGIQPYVAHMAGRQPVQDGEDVLPSTLGVGVDVNLLGGEGGPDQARLARPGVLGKGQARTRAVNAGQVGLGGPVREDRRHGQEHAVVRAALPAGHHILELAGFP